jgi:DNA repair exonuclease SbcCD ATPase subunit
MAQDLRDLLKEEKEQRYHMKPGHEGRFARRLEAAVPASRKKRHHYYLIAASVILVAGFAMAMYIYLQPGSNIPVKATVADTTDKEATPEQLSLGDLSPDLQKIEQYYVANINMQLSELEVSSENKDMVDSFMERLAELNQDYAALNRELNTLGPNDQTINALIINLQLRLKLLYKLKDKMDNLKSLENETESAQTI